MDYYRRFPGDYARDTQELNLREHGAYNRLLDFQYSTESPIKSIRHANVICRSELDPTEQRSNQRAIKLIFEKYFTVFKDGGYWNKRVLEEIAYASAKRSQAKDAAYSRHNRDNFATKTRQERDSSATASRQTNDINSFTFNESGMRTHSGRNAIPDNQTTKLNNQQQEPLADWIPLGLWRDYTAMRERLKRPLTPGAIDILIQDLDKLRRAGEDVSEVLRQAISGGWFAFRAIRKEKQNGKSESFQDQRSRKSAAAIENVLGRFEKTPSDIRGTLPPTDK